MVFAHTSLIKFLEARFARGATGVNTDLVESNITPWRRAVTGDLSGGVSQLYRSNQAHPLGRSLWASAGIFTTAAALDMGMGINATLDVPSRFEAKGLQIVALEQRHRALLGRASGTF